MSKEKRVIPFSPPDISETEILEVAKTLESGWIKSLNSRSWQSWSRS